jgi:hypothetical protein
MFGIKDDNLLNIDAIRITEMPEGSVLYGKVMVNCFEYSCLICIRGICMKYDNVCLDTLVDFDVVPENDSEITTAWSKKGFAIVVSKVNMGELDELYQAIVNKDVAMGVNIFKYMRNGFHIVKLSSLDNNLRN